MKPIPSANLGHDWLEEAQYEEEQAMKNIAAAFVKAKREFGPALKDKTNPAFRSRYADLGACIDAVEDALLKHGIAFYQETFEDSSGVTVETVFMHESSEIMRCGKLHVPASKQDPQGYGSALTYARRYSLMAACGIAPEDDDGNAASKASRKDPVRYDPFTNKENRTPTPLSKSITPTDGAEADCPPDQRPGAEEAALYMIDCHRAGKDIDAISFFYAPDSFASNEQRVYCWHLMKSESKLRSTIKANKPAEVAA